MAVRFERIIHSRIFEFIVGPEQTSFRIHSSAAAEQSNALKNLIDGATIENQVGLVFWQDVDVDTFVRFVQFAYLGDYYTQIPDTAADPNKVPQTPENTTAANQGALVPFASPTSFAEMPYHTRPPAAALYVSCKARENKNTEDYTSVFLAHARLYVLSERFGTRKLKQVILRKLHQTLAMYKLNPAQIHPIVELIRYTFSEKTPDPDNRKDELRELVAAYVGSQIKVLGRTEQFLALLEEGGAFVRDVWPVLMSQLG